MTMTMKEMINENINEISKDNKSIMSKNRKWMKWK